MRSARKRGDPRTSAAWAGTPVRSTVAISTKSAHFPPGTRFTVEGMQGGYELKAMPCSSCGVQLRVSKVNREAFMIISPDEARV